jgi:hypothetical protein
MFPGIVIYTLLSAKPSLASKVKLSIPGRTPSNQPLARQVGLPADNKPQRFHVTLILCDIPLQNVQQLTRLAKYVPGIHAKTMQYAARAKCF